MKLISVIIPVYNIAPYLPNCLDSLMNQTYENLEIIAVDDGSTDDSGRILDEYSSRDNRIKVIHKRNEGVSAARNDALDIASGDYIGFVDGDDTAEYDMFEFLLNNAEQYNADISHCGFMLVREGCDDTPFYGTGEVWIQDHEKGLIDLLKGDRIEPGCWNKLYRSELFDDIRFEKTILYNEDNLINFYLFKKANKSVYSDECKYNYIRRENSACTSEIADKHVFHPVKVKELVLKACLDESENVKRIAKTAYLRTNISTYTLLTKKEANKYKEYKKQYRSNIKSTRDCIGDLNFSGRIHALMILYAPWLCKPVFSIFYKLKKDKYR